MRAHGRLLRTPQLVLLLLVAALILMLAALLVRTYLAVRALEAEHRRDAPVSLALANVQREVLMLQVEGEPLLSGRTAALGTLRLRLSLLRRQIAVARVAFAPGSDTRSRLDALEKQGAAYVGMLTRLRDRPPADAGRRIEEAREIGASATSVAKQLYDREEHRALARNAEELAAQERTAIVLLLTCGVLLLLVGAFGGSVWRRVSGTVARLAAFTRLNPLPLIELTADGSIAFCNPAAARLSGALTSGEHAALLPDAYRAIVARALASGCVERHECEIAGLTIAWSFFPIAAEGRVHCYGEDVTERKRAEALASLQQRVGERVASGVSLGETLDYLLRLLEERCADGTAVISLLEEDGSLRTVVAPSLEERVATANDEAALVRLVALLDRADFTAEPSRPGQHPLPKGSAPTRCWSTPILRADGGSLGQLALVFPEPREPSPDERQLCEVGAQLAQAALERASHEELLAAAERKHERLIKRLPLVTYSFGVVEDSLDPHVAEQHVSAQIEALLGYTATEWLADPGLFERVLHPDDRGRVMEELRRARRESSRFRSEYRLVARSGREVWVQDEAVHLRDATGRIVTVEGFMLDVTERKELEARLHRAQKLEALGRFAGGVAHDFNNLMMAVVGFGELVALGLPDQSPARAQIQQIVDAGNKATALTNQLLAFSRKQVLQPRSTDLNAIVRDAELMLQRLIGEDVALTSTLDPALAPVLADPAQLEQVIMNLAVNARDAMPSGGRLMIETSAVAIDPETARARSVEPGAYAALVVRDSGIGMNAETREQIFEPFFTTKGDAGTGLGLATVFGIVTQTGGAIHVDSEPGRGSTFTILLPHANGAAEVRIDARAPRPLPRGNETILLVEDEALVREFEATALRECGYTVLAAGSPGEALDIAASYEGPVHLLLTDVVLPELSGRELAAHLQRLHPELQVLYVSGYPDDEIVRHGIRAGEANFLAKPAGRDALIETVRELLDSAMPERHAGTREAA